MTPDTTPERGIELDCIWCGGPGRSALNETSLLMEYGVTEDHRKRLYCGEVAFSTHTTVYCPDCGGTLYRHIVGEVRQEPAGADEATV